MRKYLSMIAMMLWLLLLVSCTEGTLSDSSSETEASVLPDSTQVMETFEPTSIPTEVPSTQPLNSPSPSQETPQETTIPEYTIDECKEIYRNFLTENYQTLHEVTDCGISGLGFIDLDLDGCIEMIVFNAGASAAMGVEIFDIIDSKVECITSSLLAIRDAFNGDYTTKTYINCNYFDDFRLMESKDGKERFFVVNSGNGNAEFDYSELIRFGCDEGALTLSQVAYKYTEYELEMDEDNLKLPSQDFEVGEKATTEDIYNGIISEYNSAYIDTDFDAKGVFGWEKSEYSGDFDSFVKLMDEAFSLTEQNQKLTSSNSDE